MSTRLAGNRYNPRLLDSADEFLRTGEEAFFSWYLSPEEAKKAAASVGEEHEGYYQKCLQIARERNAARDATKES